MTPPDGKTCGAPAPDVFRVARVADRADVRNVSCGEPAGHRDTPHRFVVEW